MTALRAHTLTRTCICSVSAQQQECCTNTHYIQINTPLAHTQPTGYFQEVDSKDGYSGHRGWFASDRHGRCVKFVRNDKPEDFSKSICADSVSGFAYLYHKYAQGFLNKDDTLFKNNFCNAYQAMGTIGYNFISKDEYTNVAKNFIIA
jgi:hypothetical protein